MQLQTQPKIQSSAKRIQVGAHYLGNGECEFTVWAPHAETVTVQIIGLEKRMISMQRQDKGYWQIKAADIEVGNRYLYQLNGEEGRPDPASYFQPQGVHQPSQVIDHHFVWSDENWSDRHSSTVSLEEMIIYELHVGTFTPEGTFEAIVERLPDLKELGVNAIEIMPIAQFSGDHPTDDRHAYRNWGYDGVYLYAVQNSYGRPEDLKRLVNACHQQGISVILDVVYNHFGPEGNYISQFAPFFTENHKTPWGSALNFDDAYSTEVRHFFIQNALYWLREYHIDALRLDAVHAIYDYGAKHFLEELSEEVLELSQQRGQRLYLIAESDLNNPRLIQPIDKGGYGINAQWSDDFHHALYTLLTRDETGYYADYGECQHLAKAYQDAFVYDWQYSSHRQRFHGRSAKDCSPFQFIVCIQNHDQIGNQMMGDRLSTLVSLEALKLAAGATLLSPYVPLLFMGEEYGEEAPFTYFVSHSDPDLIQAVREGRKQEFAAFHNEGSEMMAPEAPETFLKCKLNWESRKTGKHQMLWSWYQRLIQLRKSLPALMEPDWNIESQGDDVNQWVWWRRWSQGHQVLCLMNFSQDDITVQPILETDRWQKVLDSADQKWMGAGSLTPDRLTYGQKLTLRSQSFTLYQAS